jgi:bacillithiol biosynthesis cysteine-adding enzyme BshC
MMAEMERSALPLSRLPQATHLFLDYLENFPKVSKFYAHPHDDAGVIAAAREAQRLRGTTTGMETSAGVVEILRRQNQELGEDESVARNLDRLRDGAVAIVTGQQIALFGGPAYTIYKAVTAIHWARWLSERDIPAVPIFWMASEDHDFAEVSHVEWASHGETTRMEIGAGHGTLSTPGDTPGGTPEGGPVGDIMLGGIMESVVGSATAALEGPHGEEISDALRAAYRAGETLGSAFGKLLARLFAGRGLILLDPRDAAIHQMAKPVLRAAAEQAEPLMKDFLSRGKALEAAGYHAQVKVTAQSTLLFRLVEGKREPVRRRGEGYSAEKLVFTREELLAAIDQHPEEFSANALLRPVMQDALLPTAAYVGGPAEVAYFAQSEALYRKLNIRMPAVLPRASFTLVDARTARILRKYKLNVADLFASGQRVRERMENQSLPKGLARRFRTGEKNLARLLKTLRSPLRRLDPTLLGALDTAQRKMLYQYAKLSAKTGRAEGFRTGVLEGDKRRLTDILYPKRGLQERTLSALPFLAARPGDLIDELLDIIRREGAREHHIMSLR